MTAVNWLDEKLQDTMYIQYGYINGVRKVVISLEDYMRLKKEAIELEKQQHGNTWDSAIEQFCKRGGNLSRASCDFDDYYAETYGSKGSDGHELDDDIPPTSQYFPTSSQTQHNSPKVENKTSFGEVSDDEIEKQADIIDSGMHRMFFIAGARWYREQLKTKQ